MNEISWSKTFRIIAQCLPFIQCKLWNISKTTAQNKHITGVRQNIDINLKPMAEKEGFAKGSFPVKGGGWTRLQAKTGLARRAWGLPPSTILSHNNMLLTFILIVTTSSLCFLEICINYYANKLTSRDLFNCNHL